MTDGTIGDILDRFRQSQQNAPPGHDVKGVSTLYDAEGNVKLQWVKTHADKERERQAILTAAEELKKEIPRQAPITPPAVTNSDLLSCYVVTDYHIGMLSWPEETGDDWNTDIAEELLMNWLGSAILAAPASDTAILCQLGDFLHYDSLEAVTPTSKHVLDADTRFQKVVAVAIRVLRNMVNMLLEKHQSVHIIMAEGNHDMASSVWLRALFAEKYADNPRITVDNSPDPYYAYEWGRTSLFFHHGHKAKMAQLSEVFAGKFRPIFGRTKYSYAHLGHYHHVNVKESRLMIVEQHPTLAAKDAYASRGGYLSQRGASVITYHRNYGECARVTIRPEMVTKAAPPDDSGDHGKRQEG